VKKDKKTCTALYYMSLPTDQQKENMLNRILSECRKYDMSPAHKIYRLITVCPWRLAFGFSLVQTVICTIIWGNEYTNLILRFFGG